VVLLDSTTVGRRLSSHVSNCVLAGLRRRGLPRSSFPALHAAAARLEATVRLATLVQYIAAAGRHRRPALRLLCPRSTSVIRIWVASNMVISRCTTKSLRKSEGNTFSTACQCDCLGLDTNLDITPTACARPCTSHQIHQTAYSLSIRARCRLAT
jgi:hypothetical protein